MISLDYKLVPAWNEELATVDLRAADLGELRYDLFLGDILFRVDNADFSAPWNWVPILDFCYGFQETLEDLPEGETDKLDFTESDSQLWFERTSNRVRVSANYSPDVAEVPYDALLERARSFCRRVFGELTTGFPDLRENQAFQAMQHELGLSGSG